MEESVKRFRVEGERLKNARLAKFSFYLQFISVSHLLHCTENLYLVVDDELNERILFLNGMEWEKSRFVYV